MRIDLKGIRRLCYRFAVRKCPVSSFICVPEVFGSSINGSISDYNTFSSFTLRRHRSAIASVQFDLNCPDAATRDLCSLIHPPPTRDISQCVRCCKLLYSKTGSSFPHATLALYYKLHTSLPPLRQQVASNHQPATVALYHGLLKKRAHQQGTLQSHKVSLIYYSVASSATNRDTEAQGYR